MIFRILGIPEFTGASTTISDEIQTSLPRLGMIEKSYESQLTRLITFFAKEHEDVHRRIFGGLVNVERGEVWSSYPITEQAAINNANHLSYDEIKSSLGIVTRSGPTAANLEEDD